MAICRRRVPSLAGGHGRVFAELGHGRVIATIVGRYYAMDAIIAGIASSRAYDLITR